MIFDNDPYDSEDKGHGDDWVEAWAVAAIMLAVVLTSSFFVWLYVKGWAL